MDFGQLFDHIQKILGGHPILEEIYAKVREELSKIGRVNILIAGKTGVGKSTLVNAVFGKTVATTGAGRPVTDEIRWYEPVGLPVRLCDTKGLELADFNKILADLEAEIERRASSGKTDDRVHILWLCIAEPGGRVEKGEEQLLAVCERHRIPTIVVLTKAIGKGSFEFTVKELLPGAKKVIRILAEKWNGHHGPFGLEHLIQATTDLLPEETRNAFDAAQRIIVEHKRNRALEEVAAAATAAATAALVPVPVADAAAVLAVNIGMIARVSVIMGVQLSMDNIKTIAGSMLAAMATTSGGRLISAQILKLIPGVGDVAGSVIMAAIAGSTTYGLGCCYTEFLKTFHGDQRRMPNGEEINAGFRTFWETWGTKSWSPPEPKGGSKDSTWGITDIMESLVDSARDAMARFHGYVGRV
jgi:uncharacterized protein (DUF697 family)/GTP-binding protein EngB required for normal cell division